MNTNDPGREPEPTDAELAELRKWKADAIAWLNDNRPLNLEGINRVGGELGYSEAREFFRTYQGSASEGFKLFAMGVHRGYVLGVNAGSALLFDPELSGARPMPDTPAPDEQDATLVKLIDLLTRTANAVKGQPGELKQHGWADLPDLCTALTARVAELERMLLAVYYRKDEGLTDEDFAAVIALIARAGKEPTDA